MVIKDPKTLKELKRRCASVPKSEITFYHLLDTLSDEWYAWHSVVWAQDLHKDSGEGDFVLFHPKKGFLVVEVKGGLISTEGRTFYSTNTRTHKKYALKRSPFFQAKNTMYYIRDFYIERAKKTSNNITLLKHTSKGPQFPLSFSFAVFFPDTSFKEHPDALQFSYERIFDYSDLREVYEWQKLGKVGSSPLEDFLCMLLDVFQDSRAQLPDASTFFIKIISPKMNTYINRKHYIQQHQEELEKVNTHQDFLINALSRKKKCFFQGSAGSGKTFIAMKKALKCYKEGNRILFLCYNAELRNSIESYFSQKLELLHSQFQKNLTISTLHAFLYELGSSLLLGNEYRRLSECIRKYDFEKAIELLPSTISDVPESFQYDGIIIDEAQDIPSGCYSILQKLFRDPKSALFYIFFDTSQDIYSDSFVETQLGMDPTRDLIILDQNLRNTYEIARWLELSVKLGKYNKYSGITGFKVSKRKFKSGKDALLKAMAIIMKDYYEQGINSGQILILSNEKLNRIFDKAYHQQHSYYYPLRMKTGSSKKRYFIIEPYRLNRLEELKEQLDINGDYYALMKTIHGFKGLERDIIFLLINQNLPELEKMIYIGASRAKFKLHVYLY